MEFTVLYFSVKSQMSIIEFYGPLYCSLYGHEIRKSTKLSWAVNVHFLGAFCTLSNFMFIK